MAHLPQLAAIERDFPLTVSELITLAGGGSSVPFVAGRCAPSAYGVGRGDGGAAGNSSRRSATISVGSCSERCSHADPAKDAAVTSSTSPSPRLMPKAVAVAARSSDAMARGGRNRIAVLHDLDLVRARFSRDPGIGVAGASPGVRQSALAAMAA